MLVKEPVEADDPLVRPGREKLGGEAGHDDIRRQLVQASFLAQVPPEDGCPDLRDRIRNEGDRAFLAAQLAQ